MLKGEKFISIRFFLPDEGFLLGLVKLEALKRLWVMT